MSTTYTRLFVVAFMMVAMLSVFPGTAWGQLTVTDDTYVTGAAPTTPNGSVGSLVVQGSTTGKPSISYIRFDLSSLGGASATQVQKATLRLYVSAVTVAGGFDVVEVTSPAGWAEGTLTFNTLGANSPGGNLLNASPISVPYPNGKYQYILVDVTQAVRDWLTTPSSNFGLALKPHDTSISVAFASKEDTTYSHDPVLNVVLSLTNGTVTSIGTGAGLTGGPITGSGTIALVPATGITLGGVKAPSCASGSHFSGIAIDGALNCTADSTTTSLSFSAITGGTNSGQGLVVGNGSSLIPMGTGTITATSAAFATSAGSATTASTATNATNSSQLGGVVAGNYARLDISNIFNGNQSIMGGKQTLAASGLGFASLNIPVNGTAPTSPAMGDVWLTNSNPHLNFRDMNGTPQMLAFTSDVTMANASTLTSANSYTDTKTSAEASARIAGDATTLSSANAHADAGDTATLSSANGYTNITVGNEAAARTSGDTATLASANTYTDAEKARAMAAEALKAKLAGGNIFTGGKQTLAAADTGYASLKVPVATNPPTTLTQGDVWLGSDPHLQFQTATGTESLAFSSDVNTANAAITAETSARQAADATLTTNLSNEVTRAQAAEGTLTSNLAAEVSTRAAADTLLSASISNEASARQAADAAEATARASAITAAQALDAMLASPNTFTADNTFTGAKVDLSGASATLPFQITSTPPLATGSTCADGQMLLYLPGSPGQQLYICKFPSHDGWTLFDDESDVTAAITAETTRATGAESLLTTHLNSEISRAQGAESNITANLNTEISRATGAEANLQTGISNETAARMSADSGLSISIASEVTRATGAETTLQGNIDSLSAASAKLAGGNSFIGDQSITGNAAVNGTLTLPAVSTVSNTPAASHVLNLQGWDGTNPTVFQWLVNAGGKLDLFTGISGQTPGSSGLLIGPDGKITFATGQTFPGTQNALTAGTGIDITGSTISNTGSTSVDGTTILNGGTALNPSLSVGTITEAQVYGLTTDLSNETAARIAGDSATLTSANQFTGSAVAAEAALRATADSATLASANAYTDGQVATINNNLTLKANLAGGNSFTGDQSITGNTSITGNATVNGLLALPASAPGNTQSSNAFQLNATDSFGFSQSAQLQTLADGSLSFQFGPTLGPISQKLSIAPTGLINFALGQTFPGAVTNIATAGPITGGPITTTGTIACPTCITSGSLTAGQLVVGAGGQGVATGNLTGEVTSSGTTTALAGTIATAHTFSNAGNSFTGNGAGLTSLTAANISAGTAGINISGNAATATTAGSASTAAAVPFSGVTTGTNATALTIGTGGSLTTIGTGTINATNLGGVVAANYARVDQANTFTGTNIMGNTGGAGGLILPAAQSGANKDSFPLDFRPTITGSNNVDIFRILALGDGSEKWDFQFCSPVPCAPVTTGLQIAKTGIISFAAGQTFPGAGTGTVTSVATGTGLTGGPISSSGTISIDTTVVPQLGAASNTFTGSITASSFTGSGSGLTTLSASNISSGTLADARTSANVAKLASAQTWSALQTFGTNASLDASDITSGTLASARLSGSYGISISGNAATATSAGNVSGIVAVANGGTGVNASNTATNLVLASPNGSSGAPTFRAIAAADLPAPQNTRNICYIAGSETTGAPTLDTTYSQKNFFYNLIGAMTPTKLACQTNAGTATVQINKNGGLGNLSNTLSCSSTWSNTGTFVSSPTIGSNDELDFALTSPSGVTRVTVCLAATVN